MSTSTLGLFLRHMALSEEVSRLRSVGDHQLLAVYESERGQPAFAELMRRHGPMVLRTCRRVLGHGPDAEDAFQATFVLLACKAGSLSKREALGGWLHRVAYHSALQVLRRAVRRKAHERQASAMTHPHPDPSVEATWNEILPILDAELEALPEQARRLLIACYLQGKTHAEAATELGLPLGSLARRLEKARGLLAKRLARRGITVSSILLAVLLEETAKGSGVPAVVLVHTLEATRVFTDQAAGMVSVNVARLVNDGLAEMTKGWTHLGLALAGCLSLLGAGLIACHALKVWPDRSPEREQIAAPILAETTPLAKLPSAGKHAEKPERPEPAPPARLDLFGAPLPEHAVARMGMARFRHAGPVTSVAYAPDGKTIASASWDKTVRIWDAATGKELRKLQGHDKPVNAVAFAPDGKTLASADDDETVRLWDAATGKELRRLKGHQQAVAAVAFSPNGKELVSASVDQSVRIWDLSTGREQRRLQGHTGPVLAVIFSADGQTLVSAGMDQTVRLWNARSGEQIGKLEGHRGPIFALALCPDVKTLASGGGDKTIRLWDVAAGRELRKLPGHGERVHALAFTPDGRTLVSGSKDLTIRSWDVNTGTELRSLVAHLGHYAHWGPVTALAFSRDGKSLVSGGWDCAVRPWDWASGKPLHNWEGHQERIGSVVFSPDGKTVASASLDNTARLWDAATGKQLRRQDGSPGSAFYTASFSPDGKTLAIGSHDKAVYLWDVATGRQVHKLTGHTGEAPAVAFSPDGKSLASASPDQTVRLWNLAAGLAAIRVDIWKTGTWAVTLAFSPDGKTLALVEEGKMISFRDVATAQEIAKLEGHPKQVVSVAFSPDGKTLASAGFDGTVRLWDVAAAKEVRRLEGHQGSVRCVAFAPRGRYVASAGDDGTVRLWELASGRECARFTGHEGDVCTLAFSRDGRRLASSGTDHTVLIWDLTGRNGGAVPAARLGSKDEERLWSDLASSDATRAYRAGWLLASVPDRAVDLLRRRLREPLKPVDPLRFILGREATDFPGLEAREAEELRIVRAVAVLEEIGSGKAKELLREVAERARQAQASIDRELGRRP